MEYREVGLSLQSLTEQSLKTSRRLDDTYYSILEKVSTLRQTIGNLQELYDLTKELHENFQTDTQEIVEDVQGQLAGFQNFDAQQQQVKDLEERIRSGKEKAESLTTRLEDAKKRVDLQAKLEAEGEARTTRMYNTPPVSMVILTDQTGRLRVLWGTLSIIAGVIIIIILLQQLKPIHSTHSRTTLDFGSRDLLVDIEDAPIPHSAKEAITGPLTARPTQVVEPPPLASSTSVDDSGLRMFDEL